MTEIGFFEGEGKDRFFFALGRNAIYAAFLSAGLKAGDKVLTPAFDCDGTLQPFKALGLEPVFYRSDPYTFQVDIADIVEKLSAGPKMVHVINHFGFPQPWDELLALRKKSASLSWKITPIRCFPATKESFSARSGISPYFRSRRISRSQTEGCLS